MKDVCPRCKSQTKTAHPPKFKFAKYLKYFSEKDIYDSNQKPKED